MNKCAIISIEMIIIIILKGGVIMTVDTTHRSKKRDAILNLLRSTDTHPTAEWIHYVLKDEMSLGILFIILYRLIIIYLMIGMIKMKLLLYLIMDFILIKKKVS